MHESVNSLNKFAPNATFLYPLKTSENHEVLDLFTGYRNARLAANGLTTFFYALNSVENGI